MEARHICFLDDVVRPDCRADQNAAVAEVHVADYAAAIDRPIVAVGIGVAKRIPVRKWLAFTR